MVAIQSAAPGGARRRRAARANSPDRLTTGTLPAGRPSTPAPAELPETTMSPSTSTTVPKTTKAKKADGVKPKPTRRTPVDDTDLVTLMVPRAVYSEVVVFMAKSIRQANSSSLRKWREAQGLPVKPPVFSRAEKSDSSSSESQRKTDTSPKKSSGGKKKRPSKSERDAEKVKQLVALRNATGNAEVRKHLQLQIDQIARSNSSSDEDTAKQFVPDDHLVENIKRRTELAKVKECISSAKDIAEYQKLSAQTMDFDVKHATRRAALVRQSQADQREDSYTTVYVPCEYAFTANGKTVCYGPRRNCHNPEDPDDCPKCGGEGEFAQRVLHPAVKEKHEMAKLELAAFDEETAKFKEVSTAVYRQLDHLVSAKSDNTQHRRMLCEGPK